MHDTVGTQQLRGTQAIVWPLVLAGAAIAGSMAYACILPFSALAVMVAATMAWRSALTTMLGIWATNQLLGFTVLGYPHTSDAYGWGAAIGIAALAAVGVALAMLREISLLRLGVALVAAFSAYEGILFAYAQVAGGLETFSPAIVGRIALNDAVWLVGLYTLYIALAWSAPSVFAARRAIRTA